MDDLPGDLEALSIEELKALIARLSEQYDEDHAEVFRVRVELVKRLRQKHDGGGSA